MNKVHGLAVVLIACLAAWLPGVAAADSKVTADAKPATITPALSTENAPPQLPVPIVIHPEIQKRFDDADVRYYETYYKFLEKKSVIHLEKFEWQARASEVLLWVVVFVVVSGIAFSGFQLLLGAGVLGGKKWVGQPQETSIEVSASKFRLSSSVIGLVILVLSIVFLHMFLGEVYRLRVVDDQFRVTDEEQKTSEFLPERFRHTAAANMK